ncbi:Protein neprosin [Cardamine amara subsp. amara]|uniref:Protein neprosin n=1 Tax=Cardamine amara subsp. amara TaxID=228776 RepID=A0ABD0ZR32_CARAN
MDFVLKLVAFIFTVSIAQSKEIVRDSRSFKLNGNIIYECVDLYKQPSLSHPLLQNHQIQLEPSFSISKPKNQVKNGSKSKNIIECLNGTVPILKNTKEYVASARYWEEKIFKPHTAESHGSHIAGVRSEGQGPYHGVSATLSVHDLNISGDQASYANIYVGSGVNNEVNFIQTGWMVNPSLFGDGRTWSYGYWKGANGKGCYNTICPGFIQVSKTDHLSGPLPHFPGELDRAMSISIQQDKKTGNWWTSDIRRNEPDVHIGYWPKELFDLLKNSADIVGVLGEVQASPSGISPPMGNGHRPTEEDIGSAHVEEVQIIDSNFVVQGSGKYKFENILDSDKCYGLIDGKDSILFKYGGPGGNSCGI